VSVMSGIAAFLWPTNNLSLNFETMFGTSFVGSESTMAIGLSREVDIVFHSFECHSLGDGTVLPKEKP
jgi:hypothetical protein